MIKVFGYLKRKPELSPQDSPTTTSTTMYHSC